MLACMCMYVRVCVFMYVCMLQYMCVYVCVCVREREREGGSEEGRREQVRSGIGRGGGEIE